MPGPVLLAARLVLAGVFAAAGLAKVADREGARQALIDFGAPRRWATRLAVALPLGELAVAGALLPAGSALVGAGGALALLLLFSAAIAVSLARGQAPDCHCFGQLHSTPTSRWTLVRNGALAALAACVVGFGWNGAGPSAVAWLGALHGTGLVLLVAGAVTATVVALAAWGLLQGLRAYGRLLLRVDALEAGGSRAGVAALALTVHGAPAAGLPVGTRAPDFDLPALDGQTVTLSDLLVPARPLLLLFSDPGCGPCGELMPAVAGWQREHADTLTIAIISDGDASANRRTADKHVLGPVLLGSGRTTAEAYRSPGTPSAVLVDTDGLIASPQAAGAGEITALVETAISGSLELRSVATAEGPALGDPAPSLTLPDLNRSRFALADLRGAPALLLFWNTDCGFCASMREELLAHERAGDPRAARLVILSSGEREATRRDGFHSLVLLDEDSAAAHAFGAGGTPMAIMLDAEGRVASGLAAGAEEVLALARGGSREALAV